MNDFLKSIGFVREFTLTLNCDKSVFLRALKTNVDPPGFEFMEAWTKGAPFKGEVTNEGFWIRRRQPWTPNGKITVTISGQVEERNEKCLLSLEANADNWLWVAFGVLIITFFVIAIGFLLFSPDAEPLMALVFVVEGALFTGIPYLIIRQTLTNIQNDLEKEFTFIVIDYKRKVVDATGRPLYNVQS